MNITQTIYQRSLNLPEMAAREALDFIEFLEQRYAPMKPKNDTEAFIAALSGGLSDDFPDDITDEDLGEDAPREEFDW